MADARSPNVLWAERKDRLYITVEVQDCTDAKVDIGEDGKLSFSGHGGADKALYAFELQLLKAVSSKARQREHTRAVRVVLRCRWLSCASHASRAHTPNAHA